MINGYAQIELKSSTISDILTTTTLIDVLEDFDDEEIESVKNAVKTRKPLYVVASDGDGYMLFGTFIDTGSNLAYIANPIVDGDTSSVSQKWLSVAKDLSYIYINTAVIVAGE